MSTNKKNSLSIYSQLLATEAKKMGLKVENFAPLNRNLMILKYEDHQEIVSQTKTNLIGYATATLINNKIVINQLLEKAGFPVPDNIFTNQLQTAQDYLKNKKKLVIKPLGRTGGLGISLNVTDPKKLEAAFIKAQKITTSYDKKVICQEQLTGDDYRLTVINQKYLFAVKRQPAYVVGDGQTQLLKLIQKWNQQLTVKNRTIKITPSLKEKLNQQNLNLKSIPTQGQKVKLMSLANAHQGGIITDVTDLVSVKIKEQALRIAQHFSLPVVGIDLISQDITQTMGKIIELNACPGLSLHHFPSIGQARNPSQKIIKMLFPELS